MTECDIGSIHFRLGNEIFGSGFLIDTRQIGSLSEFLRMIENDRMNLFLDMLINSGYVDKKGPINLNLSFHKEQRGEHESYITCQSNEIE